MTDLQRDPLTDKIIGRASDGTFHAKSLCR
jgi:hypothetical protein